MKRTKILAGWWLPGIVMLGLAGCGEKSFESKLETAKGNRNSEEGAAYDEALGKAMNNEKVARAVLTCYRDNASTRIDLEGFFEIESEKEYAVALRPEGKFATCMERAYGGRTLPTPPDTPYLNHVEFKADLPQ